MSVKRIGMAVLYGCLLAVLFALAGLVLPTLVDPVLVGVIGGGGYWSGSGDAA